VDVKFAYTHVNAPEKYMPQKISKVKLLSVVVPLLLLALAITYFAYLPGLAGTFVFDDGPNILGNSHLAIQNLNIDTLRAAAFSVRSGPFWRPISMLSFAANAYNTGFNPYYFKLTNLCIHLCNGLGIFVLSLQLLKTYQIRFEPDLTTGHTLLVSLAVASAWCLHPFNLTSVLYVVQRMTSLSGLFAIWGLALFVWGRIRLLEGKAGSLAILTSLLIFTPLAVLSKETGTLMPAFMLAIEISFFHFKTDKLSARRFLFGFYAVSVALPAIGALAYMAIHPEWVTGVYLGRSFTLAERLMTEARVLWFYLGQIVFPDIAQMGLFHDDIVNSKGLLTPITTLPAIVGIAALVAVIWVARKKAPLVAFGILFFLIGHLLESTIFPLEIAHEHRNYLPMFGILLPMFFYLLYPLKYAASLPLRQFVAVLLIGLFAYGTWSRAIMWSNPFEQAKGEVEHHPNSARDNGEMGNSYATINVADHQVGDAYFLQAVHFYEQSALVDPNYTNGLFALIIVSSEKDKAVDRRWITELKHRLQYSPAESSTGNKLMQLFSCQNNKRCKLDNQDLEGLVNAALKNPTVTGPTRALVLSSYSYYLINLAKNYPAALDVMYKSVENAPQDLSYRVSLIELLTALQRSDEAKRELATLKSMDKLGTYREEIAAQEKILAANQLQQH
jgi:hypothetical protein